MHEIIKNAYPFELVDKNINHVKYDFVSKVVTEVPKRVSIIPIYNNYFNLGFGDLTIKGDGTECVDDKSRNINKIDGQIILNTVFLCCADIMTMYKGIKIIFYGNTEAKHKLYKSRIQKEFTSISTLFKIEGGIIDNLNITIDSNNIKQPAPNSIINPNDLTLEQFDPNRKSLYNIICFSELNKI